MMYYVHYKIKLGLNTMEVNLELKSKVNPMMYIISSMEVMTGRMTELGLSLSFCSLGRAMPLDIGMIRQQTGHTQ